MFADLKFSLGHPTLFVLRCLQNVCGFHSKPGRRQNLLKKKSKKSCSLDPIPTHLLLKCVDSIIPVIPRIINHSLLTGVVTPPHPAHTHMFKHAVITPPLLKKHKLDTNNLRLYRPVSNFPLLSKVLEKVMLILNHVSSHDGLEPFQSACREVVRLFYSLCTYNHLVPPSAT